MDMWNVIQIHLKCTHMFANIKKKKKYQNLVITKSEKVIVKLEVDNFELLGCKVWLYNWDKYILTY